MKHSLFEMIGYAKNVPLPDCVLLVSSISVCIGLDKEFLSKGERNSFPNEFDKTMSRA